MSNKTEITYRRIGDYFIPNLTLPPEEAKVRLGKWGMLYKDYLFNNKKVVFSLLLAEGKLYQHCAEIEKQANENPGLLITNGYKSARDMYSKDFFRCCNELCLSPQSRAKLSISNLNKQPEKKTLKDILGDDDE